MYFVYCNWQKCTFIIHYYLLFVIVFDNRIHLLLVFGFIFLFYRYRYRFPLLLVVQHFCLEANLH